MMKLSNTQTYCRFSRYCVDHGIVKHPCLNKKGKKKCNTYEELRLSIMKEGRGF